MSIAMRRGSRIVASPRAKRALARHGVDATGLQGRGPRGRILEADVLAHAAAPPISSAPVVTGPTQYLRAEIDATNLIRLNARFSPQAEKSGSPLSLGDMVLHTFIAVLRSRPELNEPQARIAVGTSGALKLSEVTPLNILDLARKRRELQAAPLQSALSSSANVAFYNAGAGRVDEWTPSLSPGAVLALGIGSVMKRSVAIGEGTHVRSTLRICLAFDETSFAAAGALDVLDQLVLFLEEPGALLFA